MTDSDPTKMINKRVSGLRKKEYPSLKKIFFTREILLFSGLRGVAN
jgi:hypothetical protein